MPREHPAYLRKPPTNPPEPLFLYSLKPEEGYEKVIDHAEIGTAFGPGAGYVKPRMSVDEGLKWKSMTVKESAGENNTRLID